MNKFSSPEGEDFQMVEGVLKEMVEMAPALAEQRLRNVSSS